MFTVKTQDFELSLNCDPDDYIWKKYFPQTGRYLYKYPDVPEFITNYEIFRSEPHTPKPDIPEVGQKWCILKPEWTINDIEDDFFDLCVGDLVEVVSVEEYEDGDWTAFVVVDERMVDAGFTVGDTIAFFTQDHAVLKVIALYK